MPLAISYRAIETGDVAQIAKLEQTLFSHPHSPDQLVTMLAGSIVGYVAVSGKTLLGYVIASYGGGEADLLIIAVNQSHQGEGVAGHLLKRLIKKLLCCEIEALFLEVRASNTRAIAFYRNHGFEEIGIRRNYYPAPERQREDAVLFRKVLPSISV